MTQRNYEEVLKEFLAAREWEDALEVNEEEGKVVLSTSITVAEQPGCRLIVEAFNESRLVDVCIYYTLKCKSSKHAEMCVLLNELNCRSNYGKFQCFREGGHVRWMHRVDFDGSSPTGQSIEFIVGPAWNIAGHFAEPIAAVALTKQTAVEALRDFDEAQQNESPAAPSDL